MSTLNLSSATALTPDEERLARKRAGRKMGWYIHATVFVLVNAGLALLSGWQGRSWAIFPALGWGIGLLVHGFVTFFSASGEQLHQTLVQQERDRIASGKALR
ncbi:MAG: 2TM domain-containing protein [Burkholderiales bacterium]|nr:2TM domain-containing protein [Burkholderiales bacterium]